MTLIAEIYMDMLVAFIINIKMSKWSDINGIILYTNVLSIAGLSVLILVPIVSLVFAYRSTKTWETAEWRGKYGAFVD